MDDDRKNAYRYLIYWAMLEIRQLQWRADRPLQLLNPIKLHRVWKQAVRAGAIADWLHNAAQFSTFEFEGFREDFFWSEHDRLVQRFGNAWESDYRAVFEARLKDRVRAAGDT